MGGFTFTRLAQAIAETKYSQDDVEQQAFSELKTLHGDEFTPDSIAKSGMFMHCFGMTGRTEEAEDIEFIILSHDGVAYIDTVSYRDEVMDAGPFKGRTVCFPVPDTFSD
jgi:hypothetical protein